MIFWRKIQLWINSCQRYCTPELVPNNFLFHLCSPSNYRTSCLSHICWKLVSYMLLYFGSNWTEVRLNEITILDLFLLHVQNQSNHQANMDILKSMYERTHNYYIAVFTALLVLFGSILGSFIALLTQETIISAFVTTIAIIALCILLISLFIIIRKINQLHRDFLNILQVYNLLSQYF